MSHHLFLVVFQGCQCFRFQCQIMCPYTGHMHTDMCTVHVLVGQTLTEKDKCSAEDFRSHADGFGILFSYEKLNRWISSLHAARSHTPTHSHKRGNRFTQKTKFNSWHVWIEISLYFNYYYTSIVSTDIFC